MNIRPETGEFNFYIDGGLPANVIAGLSSPISISYMNQIDRLFNSAQWYILTGKSFTSPSPGAIYYITDAGRAKDYFLSQGQVEWFNFNNTTTLSGSFRSLNLIEAPTAIVDDPLTNIYALGSILNILPLSLKNNNNWQPVIINASSYVWYVSAGITTNITTLTTIGSVVSGVESSLVPSLARLRNSYSEAGTITPVNGSYTLNYRTPSGWNPTVNWMGLDNTSPVRYAFVTQKMLDAYVPTSLKSRFILYNNFINTLTVRNNSTYTFNGLVNGPGIDVVGKFIYIGNANTIQEVQSLICQYLLTEPVNRYIAYSWLYPNHGNVPYRSMVYLVVAGNTLTLTTTGTIREDSGLITYITA